MTVFSANLGIYPGKKDLMQEMRANRSVFQDVVPQEINISGKRFLADNSGALYWPSERMLIVADLHLEKGSSLARRGVMLPPYDTRETLVRLAEAIDRYDVACVVALGDSLHDRQAAERIDERNIEIVHIMQEDRRWVWITGNHDPEIGECLGGEVMDLMTCAGITMRHEPSRSRITHEIAGHLHPAARLSMYGHNIRRPCFVGNRRRLILPAFGTFAGGLNVLDQAFAPLFGDDGMSVWMMGQEGLYPVATRRLRDD